MNESGKPLYEVIVVDDASTDGTSAILKGMQNSYVNLVIISISANEERSLPGKKYALYKGVMQAKYDRLLFTDADCKPVSEDWIRLMVAPLGTDIQIAAGYGKYKERNDLLNAFTRWETVHTFLQYSSYTMAGKPYMAVGRNLACTKEIWLKAQDAHIWTKLPSGDDDLLMQTMANGTNTAIIADPKSFTLTYAKTNWRDWIKQKQRHMSTGKYYRSDIKSWLSIYASSHAVSWLLFIYLLFYFNPIIIGDIMAVRCLLFALAFSRTARGLEEKNLTGYLLLFDFGWMLYNFAFSPYIIWKNKKTWK